MAEENTVSAPRKKSKRVMGLRPLTLLLILAVVIIGVLFTRSEMKRRSLEQSFEKTSQELQQVKQSTENSGQAAADHVLQNARMLMDIPNDPAPTVATITDVDALRKTNEFYNKAQNGDNLIITANRAILYSPTKNIIIDVVPVQPTTAPSATPATSPTPTPTESKAKTTPK